MHLLTGKVGAPVNGDGDGGVGGGGAGGVPPEAALVGAIEDTSRHGELSRRYRAALRAARVVVTVNPTNWDGDHRALEALASGAAVLCDPSPSLAATREPPLDGTHWVEFSASFDKGSGRDSSYEAGASNRRVFLAKLAALVHDHSRAARIGAAGRALVARSHRGVSRVDEILEAAETVRAQRGLGPRT